MWTHMGPKTDGYTKAHLDILQQKGRRENERCTKMLTFLLAVANESNHFF